MRKKIVGQTLIDEQGSLKEWLDVEQVATVEVTSEDPDYLIESVFRGGNSPGWRALDRGEQRVRLIFDQPVSIERIYLRFVETEVERTQEFVIRCSTAAGGPPKEIIRQQWNFSPAGSTTEVEDYQLNLRDVVELELSIKPDLAPGEARATLAEWRLGRMH